MNKYSGPLLSDVTSIQGSHVCMSVCVLRCCGHCEGGGTFATGGVLYKTPPNLHAHIQHGMFDGKHIL